MARRPVLLIRLAVGILAVTACAAAWAADPQVSSFTDSPDPVAAGAQVTYTAQIENSGFDDATGVVATVPAPAGATFISATAPCILNAGNVVCSLGTLGANSSDLRNLAFVFRADGPGPSIVTATLSLTSDNDTNPANDSQSQSTTVTQGADLVLVSSDSPDPVVGGALITYSLNVGNAGPNASGDIVVTDTLSPSVAFVSASGSGWSCGVAGSVVTCSHAGPHPAAASVAALSIVGRANSTAGTVTNSASVAPAAGGTVDPNPTNNTSNASTTVFDGADVYIAQKTVTSSRPAVASQNVSFNIEAFNNGPATAINAVVSDNLPAGWTFVSAGGPNWTCTASGLAITCSRAVLPTSATDIITVVATAPSSAVVGQTGTTYSNTAAISSASTDPNPGNNTGSVNITVQPDGADLRIAKRKTPDPVAQGSPLTSTITVTNDGPRSATGPLRVVELMAGETYVSASGAGWSCGATAAPTIVCNNSNVGGLAVGTSLPDLVIVAPALRPRPSCRGRPVPCGRVL